MSKFNKVAVVLVALGLLMATSPASAVTVEELMAQIALLQSQIATLQTGSTTSSVSSCSFADASASSLTVGSRGTGVSDLQTFLKNQGSAIYPSGMVTGYFGSLSKAGVAAFQSARGISPAVGYFGPLTRAAVRPLCLVGATPTPTVSAPVVSAPVVTGALNVSLASDSPAAANVPAKGALVPFTKVVFTATGGQVVIDSLTVQRVGLSVDADFSGVVLIDPQGNQVGYAKTLGSTHQAVFGNDLTIPAGTSATYTIAGNIATTPTAGDVAALSLVSVVTKDSASVGGSLPVTGSSMTMVNITIGTVTVTTGGFSPGASTQRVGTTGYNLSSVNIQANTDDMKITKIRWYQNGTAADADVSNLKLKVAGVQVGATLASATAKYATFDLSASPVLITKGLTKEFALVGDLVSGSGRTIIFDIYDNTDISAMGVSFAFSTIPTYTGVTTQPYFAPNTTTVANGAFNVSKGVLASTFVAAGATSVPIGAFIFNAQGEDIQVTSAKFTYGSYTGITYDEITNVGLYNAAGSLVAGPVDVVDAATDYTTFTDTWVIPAGTNTFTLKANIAAAASGTDLFTASLDPDTNMTTRGVSTNMTITSDTTASTDADIISVRAGALNVSTSATPAVQTYIQGQVQAALANFVFDATGSGEDVRISTIVVTETTDTTSSTLYTKTANLTMYEGGVALSPVMQPANPASTATSITVTFNMTTPIVIAKGTSKTIALKGDIIGNSSQTFKFGLANAAATVVATGATTSAAVAEVITENLGQYLTFSTSGSALVATDSSNAASKYISAGSTGVEVGAIRLTSTSESVQLSNILIDVANTHGATVWHDIAKAYLYDGSVKVAELVPTSSAMYFTLADNALVIPSGYTGKLVSIKLDTNAVGVGQTGVSGDALTLSVAQDAYTLKGVASGTNLATSATSGTYTGNALYYARTYPSVTPRVAISSTMSSGTKDLYKFSVSAPSYGDVALAKMSFLVSTYTPNQSAFTGASTSVASFNMYDDLGNALFLTATSGKAYVDYVTGTSGTTQLVNAAVFTGSNFSGAASSIYIVTAGTTRTFTLKGTVTNPQVGSSITTVLQGDSAMAGTYPAPAFAGGINGGSSDLTLGSGPLNAFIWSDLWDGSATSTTLAGNRWFNGYRLSGLVASDTGTAF